MRLREMADDSLNPILAGRTITDPEEFYQNALLQSDLFDRACKLYPDYNGSQSLDAADWIVDQIESVLGGNANWENMRDEVYDKIVAGLT